MKKNKIIDAISIGILVVVGAFGSWSLIEGVRSEISTKNDKFTLRKIKLAIESKALDQAVTFWRFKGKGFDCLVLVNNTEASLNAVGVKCK